MQTPEIRQSAGERRSPAAGVGEHLALRAAATTLLLWTLGSAVASAQIQVPDAPGDAVIRRTDAGADGPIDPAAHRLPDVLLHRIGYWTPAAPAVDLFEGAWSTASDFFRLDLVFDGLVNPPGMLGGPYPYDPFRYGPHPVFGYVELDMDADAGTGGELLEPQYRYLGNAARFGGLPWQPYYAGRAAYNQSAFDQNLSTPPLVDRSGEEFHIAFHGWQITSIAKSPSSGNIFQAGAVWVLTGRLFHRAHGYEPFSYACCVGGAGSYEPVVKLRFAHSIPDDQTTVSLVYPLTNAGAAAIAGAGSVQPLDGNVANQNSVLEALDDLAFSVNNAPPGWFQHPNYGIIQAWGAKNPAACLDPAAWRCNFVVGTSYSAVGSGGFYVWTDVGPDVLTGDFDGSGTIDAQDIGLLDAFILENDGTASDEDGQVDGRVQIGSFGPNFSRFDLNYDGRVDGLDRALVGGPVSKPADLDDDGDVDLDDFGLLQRCLGLPEAGHPLPPECIAADLNTDANVNELDFARLIGCRSGPAIPAAADCTD